MSLYERTAAKLSSHFEWGRARRARAAARASAAAPSSKSAASAASAAAAGAVWTVEDDAKVLGELDALRLRRTAAAIAKKLADASAAAAGAAGEESDEDEVWALAACGSMKCIVSIFSVPYPTPEYNQHPFMCIFCFFLVSSFLLLFLFLLDMPCFLFSCHSSLSVPSSFYSFSSSFSLSLIFAGIM